MKNETKRAALQALANAPTIAAIELVKRLPADERAEAIRLFRALGIKMSEGIKGGKKDE